MVLDGGIGTTTAVGTAVNISLRLFQVIYEFKAVGQQTLDLLDSTGHVSSTLDCTRTLRRRKSQFLSSDEKKWIDGVLTDTERCLQNVASLVEPARVDLQTKSRRVGLINRGLFVFRDSPKVATNLARLSLTHQSLNTAMGVLCSKGAPWQPVRPQENWLLPTYVKTSSRSDIQDSRSPPSYEKSEILRRRQFPPASSRTNLRAELPSQDVHLHDTYPSRHPADCDFQFIDRQATMHIAELEAPGVLEGPVVVKMGQDETNNRAFPREPMKSPEPGFCSIGPTDPMILDRNASVPLMLTGRGAISNFQSEIRTAELHRIKRDRYQQYLERHAFQRSQTHTTDTSGVNDVSTSTLDDENSFGTFSTQVCQPPNNKHFSFDASSKNDIISTSYATTYAVELSGPEVSHDLDRKDDTEKETISMALPSRARSRGRAWLEARAAGDTPSPKPYQITPRTN